MPVESCCPVFDGNNFRLNFRLNLHANSSFFPRLCESNVVCPGLRRSFHLAVTNGALRVYNAPNTNGTNVRKFMRHQDSAELRFYLIAI